MKKTSPSSEIRGMLDSGALMLLDGATGTELDQRGVDISLPLWSARAIIEAPEVLGQIHVDYLIAGADLVTANTFRTHRRSLSRAGLGDRAEELTERAVRIARQACASASKRALVAGSMSPLEDCFSPELVPHDDYLQDEHAEMAHHLVKAGADVLLIETMNTVREAVAATRAAVATGLPTMVSVVCGRDARLLSGESVADAAMALTPLRTDAILVNCTPAPDLYRSLSELRDHTSLPIGAYANIGYTEGDQNWIETDATDPEAYARYAGQWRENGATLIGGCCGTTPAHIAALKRILLR